MAFFETLSSIAFKTVILPFNLFQYAGSVLTKSDWSEYDLHQLAGLGRLEELREAIQNWAYVNGRDLGGFAPLHFAAAYGQNDAIELLLQNGAKINLQNKETGNTALFYAIYNDRVSTIDLLHSKGANLEMKNKKGFKPIHYAVRYSDSTTMQKLTELGINVNSEWRDKITPLHIAAYFGNLDVIPVLVKNGANIHAKDKLGFTPLHYAAQSNNVDAYIQLLNLAANQDLTDSVGNKASDYFNDNAWDELCKRLTQQKVQPTPVRNEAITKEIPKFLMDEPKTLEVNFKANEVQSRSNSDSDVSPPRSVSPKFKDREISRVTQTPFDSSQFLSKLEALQTNTVQVQVASNAKGVKRKMDNEGNLEDTEEERTELKKRKVYVVTHETHNKQDKANSLKRKRYEGKEQPETSDENSEKGKMGPGPQVKKSKIKY